MSIPIDPWPFEQPRHEAVFTMRQVLDGTLPILLVCRDEDGVWQFLTGLDLDMADAKMVSLESVVRCDSSVTQLVDLGAGEEATRDAMAVPWKRQRRLRRSSLALVVLTSPVGGSTPSLASPAGSAPLLTPGIPADWAEALRVLASIAA